jgi:hypothetical protein
VSKINRLVEIEEYLREQNLLADITDNVYEFAGSFQIPEDIAEQLVRQEETASMTKKGGRKQ